METCSILLLIKNILIKLRKENCLLMKKFLVMLNVFGLSRITIPNIFSSSTISLNSDNVILTIDHKSAVVDLTYSQAEKLALCTKDSNGIYQKGRTFNQSIDAQGLVDGVLISALLSPPDLNGRVRLVISTTRAMKKPSKVTFKFGTQSLTIKELHLD